MSRTFPDKNSSLLRVKVRRRCGLRSKARRTRDTEDWLTPTRLASLRVLQWVASFFAFAQSRVVVRGARFGRGLSIATRMVMTLREQIWVAIDDAALERHARLQDALYRLLVVIDAVEYAPSCVDDCLERADEALRGGSAVAVIQACAAVEDLVAMLSVGISSARCDEKVVRDDQPVLE
jgi:hypothetical protein